MVNTTVSFACSACGRCCNSPPAMTVPELLHHEDLFVGTLGVRRGAGGALDLVTQGLDFPSNTTCPALAADGLCGIHHDRKPAMCRTVPLDPFRADTDQHVVLLQRAGGTGYIGADCLVPGHRDGVPLLVADGAVVDTGYRDQLHGHRRLLAEERALWADTVTGLLRGQVPPAPHGAPAGVLTLPLVPVLAVLAAWSDRCRDRCLRYVRNQLVLLDRQVDLARERRRPEDRPLTAEFRTYAAAYTRLAESLARGVAPSPDREGAARAEAYLGVSA